MPVCRWWWRPGSLPPLPVHLVLLLACFLGSVSGIFDHCPIERTSLGECHFGLCPAGALCINNYCCILEKIRRFPFRQIPLLSAAAAAQQPMQLDPAAIARGTTGLAGITIDDIEKIRAKKGGKCFVRGNEPIGVCLKGVCPDGYNCENNSCCNENQGRRLKRVAKMLKSKKRRKVEEEEEEEGEGEGEGEGEEEGEEDEGEDEEEEEKEDENEEEVADEEENEEEEDDDEKATLKKKMKKKKKPGDDELTVDEEDLVPDEEGEEGAASGGETGEEEEGEKEEEGDEEEESRKRKGKKRVSGGRRGGGGARRAGSARRYANKRKRPARLVAGEEDVDDTAAAAASAVAALAVGAGASSASAAGGKNVCPVGYPIGECVSSLCPNGYSCFQRSCCAAAPEINCEDVLPKCSAQLCEIDGYTNFMTKFCPRTCAKCTTTLRATQRRATVSAARKTTPIPRRIITILPTTTATHAPPPPPPPTTKLPSLPRGRLNIFQVGVRPELCTDRRSDCVDWAAEGFCDSDIYSTQQKMKFCGRSCGYC